MSDKEGPILIGDKFILLCCSESKLPEAVEKGQRRLEEEFGANKVVQGFRGVPFQRHEQWWAGSKQNCEVVVVMIGPDWLEENRSVQDQTGYGWSFIEIETAFQNQLPVSAEMGNEVG